MSFHLDDQIWTYVENIKLIPANLMAACALTMPLAERRASRFLYVGVPGGGLVVLFASIPANVGIRGRG